MTSLQFAELLIDLHLYSGLIPVTVALILWKFQTKEMRIFALNQIFSFCIFAFSIFLQKRNINNHFIDFVHSIRTIIFIFLMYAIYDKNIRHRKILLLTSILCLVSVLFDWLVVSKNEWSELNEICLSIIITSVAIYYLRKIIHSTSKKLTLIPLFWITIATIIGNTSSIFSLYFAKQALNYSTEVFLIIWNILSIIGIICKLIYAIGFFVSKKKKFR